MAMRVLLAFLVVLGVSGNAFTTVVCAAGMMPDCPQRQEKQKQACHPTPKAACHEQSIPDEHGGEHREAQPKQNCEDADGACEKANCCCEIKSGEPTASSAPATTSPQLPTQIATPPQPLQIAVIAPIYLARAIFYQSGTSPPSVVWHPDFGRAPPAA